MLQLFDCDFLSVGNFERVRSQPTPLREISNQVRNNWQLFDNSMTSRKWIQLTSYPQLSAVYPHTCSQSSLQISSLDLVSQNNLAGGKGGHCSLSQKVSNEFSLFLSHLTLEQAPAHWQRVDLFDTSRFITAEKKCRFRLDFKTGYFRFYFFTSAYNVKSSIQNMSPKVPVSGINPQVLFSIFQFSQNLASR
jgi:hypothetical protein